MRDARAALAGAADIERSNRHSMHGRLVFVRDQFLLKYLGLGR